MTNEELLEQVSQMIEGQTQNIKIIIETDVTKRIDALFDGYKLTNEKQWELERKMEKLEKRIEQLEMKAS